MRAALGEGGQDNLAEQQVQTTQSNYSSVIGSDVEVSRVSSQQETEEWLTDMEVSGVCIS